MNAALRVRFVFLCILGLAGIPALAGSNLHTTWLWHLHQPIYWPDRRDWGTDHYEAAWDTIQQQNAGRAHPSPEVLSSIFGLDDRVAAYQSRPHDAVSSVLGYANAGAQVNYSGALMENVQSLGSNNQLGYGGNWNSYNQQARGWTTSGGKTRLDLLSFTYHHALAPLISDETLEMELRIHTNQMAVLWGTSPALSRGYFPAETCFTERMIPILNKVGIAWSVVANNHLTRSCADYPLVLGSGGENCDVPNLADQINPAQGSGNYKRLAIERGCAPTAAMPFAFQVHYARYVDPNTGADSRLIIVPADQALGWRDSYSTWDLGLMSDLAARNNPAQPAIVLLAHDGDNAWSGGYSYYMEWVPQFASQAAGLGYDPSTVEQFLQENPPNTTDVVHVEDGGWVFADGDFGSPIFINWHWPPSYSANGANVVDPSLGSSDKADNWRVIVATENRVKTAQQIAGITPRIPQVRDPGSGGATPNAVELGWHYYLASLDSGFVYYGCHDDECLRAIVAQSNAVRNVDGVIAASQAADTTPPTLFPPQRHPWNPGGTNFGVQYGYKVTVATNSDFWVWTYAYDVSTITNVSLWLRLDGANAPTNDQFKTYAGGALAGVWSASNMTRRAVGPVTSGLTPQYIADYYYAKVSGITNSYVDYYVSATDAYGNTCKSPIQHVWVASGIPGSGGGVNTNGCVGRACVSPVQLTQGNPVTILYYPTGGPIAGAGQVYVHLGWNNWATVVSPDPAMILNSASNRWEFTTTAPTTATELDCDFNNGSGTWDNNGGAGQDYRFAVSANSGPQPPAQPQNLTLAPVQTNQINLSWSAASGADAYIIIRDGSPLATTLATSFPDTGLAANTSYCYYIVASNSVAYSTPSTTVCTNTPATPSAPTAPQNLVANPVQTNQINLSWSASVTATGYVVNRGGSPLAMTAATNYSDTGLAPNSQDRYSVVASNSVGLSAASPVVCTNTLAPSTNIVPFLLDGAFDYPGYLLASNGMVLYAAIRGTTLYVATWSPGTSGPNDHFIFVSDQLLASATTPAPWAKSGYIAVAANKPYLASESQVTYISWYTNATIQAPYPCFKASTSAGAMAGTIDLMKVFGSVPATLYLSAAAYITSDGGALASACPAASGLNLDPGAFLVIPTGALQDNNADGIFDRLQPALDFKLLNAQPAGSGYAINWASMPGHIYQVISADTLGVGWSSNLPGALTTAGPLQLWLSYTDTPPTTATQRFYRVQLVQ